MKQQIKKYSQSIFFLVLKRYSGEKWKKELKKEKQKKKGKDQKWPSDKKGKGKEEEEKKNDDDEHGYKAHSVVHW